MRRYANNNHLKPIWLHYRWFLLMDAHELKKTLDDNPELICKSLPFSDFFSQQPLEKTLSLGLANIGLAKHGVDIQPREITEILLEGNSLLSVLLIEANGKRYRFGYLPTARARRLLDHIKSQVAFHSQLAEKTDYYCTAVTNIKSQLTLLRASLDDLEEIPSTELKEKIKLLFTELCRLQEARLINKELENLHSRSHAELEHIEEIIRVRDYYASFSEKLLTLSDCLINIEQFRFYLTEDDLRQVSCLITDLPPLTELKSLNYRLLIDPIDFLTRVEKLSYYLESPVTDREEYNTKFVASELVRYREFFDTVAGAPMTHEQRVAIIKDDHRSLVIAAAGSGKTSVIKAKILYLISKGLAKPAEILVLAFNRDAVDEIKARLGEQFTEASNINTFHGYGLNVISEAVGTKPSLSELAEDSNQTRAEIHHWLGELVASPEHSRHIRRFFLKQLYENIKVEEFESLGHYFQRLKRIEPQSIFGTRVKSFEEASIATFLELNQISYVYEKDYEHNTADGYRRQYKPDFYLTDYDIYIEHFAIREDGTSYFGEKYVQSMEWKRQLHNQFQTSLAESYSYESDSDDLLKNLHRNLSGMGVNFIPMPEDELAERLKESPTISLLSDLLLAFLNQFKSSGYTLSELPEVASKKNLKTDRFEAFLSIFVEIFDRYQEALTGRGEIDFNDMISEAANHLQNKTKATSFRYVLVDEFQDISPARASLVEKTLNLDESTKLFCVGDDWQAINRFAGGDSSIMRDFANYFGMHETNLLTQSFRFNDKISIPSADFVTKNPFQIKKDVNVTKTVKDKRLILVKPKLDEELPIEDMLKRISDESRGSVLILGRYKFEIKDLNIRKLSARYTNLDIKKMTVHSSKGLEADYVILVGMRSGLYGFPSEITDDPLLEVIPAQLDDFDNAEERRLLYVAMTRARERVFLICDPRSESSFVEELSQRKDVELEGYFGEEVACPDCKTGRIHQKTGKYGIFFSCVNFPYCEYKATTCSSCVNGFLHFDEQINLYKCSNKGCDHTDEVCPQCKTGRVLLRSGPSGDFFGCSNFKELNCRYNRKVEPSD